MQERGRSWTKSKTNKNDWTAWQIGNEITGTLLGLRKSTWSPTGSQVPQQVQGPTRIAHANAIVVKERSFIVTERRGVHHTGAVIHSNPLRRGCRPMGVLVAKLTGEYTGAMWMEGDRSRGPVVGVVRFPSSCGHIHGYVFSVRTEGKVLRVAVLSAVGCCYRGEEEPCLGTRRH